MHFVVVLRQVGQQTNQMVVIDFGRCLVLGNIHTVVLDLELLSFEVPKDLGCVLVGRHQFFAALLEFNVELDGMLQANLDEILFLVQIDVGIEHVFLFHVLDPW